MMPVWKQGRSVEEQKKLFSPETRIVVALRTTFLVGPPNTPPESAVVVGFGGTSAHVTHDNATAAAMTTSYSMAAARMA